MKLKIRKLPVVIKSIFISILISPLFQFLFTEYNIKTLNYVLLIIAIFLSTIILLLLILMSFSNCFEYTILNNKIIKEFNFLSFNSKKVYFYNENEVITVVKNNPILSFGYESRINFYNKYKNKFLSLVIKTDDLKNLSNYFPEIYQIKKEHYRKEKQYFSNYKSVISLAINNSFDFIYFYLIFLIFSSFLKDYIYLVIGSILTIFVYLINIIYTVISTKSNDYNIGDNNIIIKKGIFFKKNVRIPKNFINNFIVKTNIFNKLFDSYTCIIKIGKLSKTSINMMDSNLSYFTKLNKKDFNIKSNFSYFIVIISLIITGLIDLILIKISVLTVVSFSIFSILTTLFLFTNSSITIGNNIMLLNNFILKRIIFIKLTNISNIKYKRIFKKYLLTFKSLNKRFYRIVNKNELENIIKIK